MDVRQFSMKEALALLGIKPPKVSKKQSQDDIDAMVESWKENELEAHYKAERIKAHPDRHGGSDEATKRFQDLGTAYGEVKANLKLRKPKIPPAQVTECRSCQTTRVPNDAAHCWKCGLAYVRVEPRTECPACEADRNPTRAKFCHACGYDYQVPDGLVERLRSVGATQADINYFEGSGQVARWRRLPATSQELRDDIHFEVGKRKIMRGGKADFSNIFAGLGSTRGGFSR